MVDDICVVGLLFGLEHNAHCLFQKDAGLVEEIYGERLREWVMSLIALLGQYEKK